MAVLLATTLLLGAALLFVVQPMVGKMLLPPFGGAPAVWNTCLVFYQAGLLLGYLHAHVVATRLALRTQVLAHGTLLLLALALGPIAVSGQAPSGDPLLALLGRLVVGVGLPFFALSATGPLLQSWFAATRRRAARDPYFLYAASNLGSLLGLVGYPTLIEPAIGLAAQARAWAYGLALLAVLVVASGVMAVAIRDPDRARPVPAAGGASVGERLRWGGLAFLPCSLMMSVTHYITTDVAPVPLLWIVPLSLYLVAFILAFSRLPRRVVTAAGVLAIPPAAAELYFYCSETPRPVWLALLLPLVALGLLCLAFLGRLAERRPDASRLTEYYLWVSLGGVLGGAANALAAPAVFRTLAEYPLGLALALGLLPFLLGRDTRPSWRSVALDGALAAAVFGLTAWLVASYPLKHVDLTRVAEWLGTARGRLTVIVSYLVPVLVCFLLLALRRRPAFGLGLAAFALASDLHGGVRQIVHRARSFFGVLTVQDDPEGDCRHLLNGRTPHGRQSLLPERRRSPLVFYHRDGPVGDLFKAFSGEARKDEVAVVGLGTGAIAAYGEPGQRMTFYEIDPRVVSVARDSGLFTYLRDSQATVEVVVGDARLRLADAPDGSYGLLLVDAFTSDAIPVHLLTREASALYFRKLAPDGVLAVHISNRYLDLRPVIGRHARDGALAGRIQLWTGRDGCGPYSTQWVVLARRAEHLGGLATSPYWAPLEESDTRPWTDDYSNLWAAFDWRRSTF
jgi:hypothetical protein